MKIGLPSRAGRHPLRPAAAAFLLVVLLVTPLLAGERYLAADRPDGVALLAPPPVPDSAEQGADLALARAVFKAATPGEQEAAGTPQGKAAQARETAVKFLEGEDGSGDRVVWLRVAALLGLVLLLAATPIGRWLGLTKRD